MLRATPLRNATLLASNAAEGVEFVPGDMVEFAAPNGSRYSGVLKEIDDKTALFDFNHPLAGVALRLEAMIRMEPGWLVQGFVMTDSGKAPDAAQAKVFFDGLAR